MILRVKSGLKRGKQLTLAQRSSPFFSDCPRIGVRSVPPHGSIDLDLHEAEHYGDRLKQLVRAEAVELFTVEDGVEKRLILADDRFTHLEAQAPRALEEEPEPPLKPIVDEVPAPTDEVSVTVQESTTEVPVEAAVPLVTTPEGEEVIAEDQEQPEDESV